MPTWAIVLTVVGGLGLWILLGIGSAIWTEEYLDRRCSGKGIRECSHYSHEFTFFYGVFSPVCVPGFMLWYLLRFTSCWNQEREA